jgi:hypothetical protein
MVQMDRPGQGWPTGVARARLLPEWDGLYAGFTVLLKYLFRIHLASGYNLLIIILQILILTIKGQR